MSRSDGKISEAITKFLYEEGTLTSGEKTSLKTAIAVPASSDDLSEGSTNKFVTDARVLATPLTGLSTASGSAITSSDTVISAAGKLQKQVTDAVTTAASDATTKADAAQAAAIAASAKSPLVAEFLYASVTGVTGTQPTANGSGSYTWTLPTGWKKIRITAINGGGGGGSGRRGAAGTACYGGGGGQGSGVTSAEWTPQMLASSVLSVFVGNAGTGGASVTTDDTNGNDGTDGGASYVLNGSDLLCAAMTNLGGAASASASGKAGLAGSGLGGNNTVYSVNIAGAGGQNSSISATGSSIAVSAGYCQLGGGAGGGISAADVGYNAGSHTFGNRGGTAATGGAAGAGTVGPTVPKYGRSQYGWGGGGGGASRNGFASGAGANGRPGIVIIEVTF